jgi:hypothetical protein
MFNIDNIIQRSTSVSSLSSNTSSSTPLYHPHPTRQNQTSSEFHIPSFSSSLYNPPLPAQQQYHHSYPYQSYSQTLSQDEWALIVSLRMMNNLSVLLPFQPPLTSAVHQQSGDVTSHQPSSFDQTGHQIQLSTYYATKVSPRTIRRVRRRENYHPVHAKIHWTINEQQAARRYQYARTHEEDSWQDVIFSDEKQFIIDKSGTVFWIPVC